MTATAKVDAEAIPESVESKEAHPAEGNASPSRAVLMPNRRRCDPAKGFDRAGIGFGTGLRNVTASLLLWC